jgi:two-component system, NtrC family, nitrogen regulation sensor histidine kinase NtrY
MPADSPEQHSNPWLRRWPRWSRRLLVTARRANLVAVLEIVSALILLGMLGTSWLVISSAPPSGVLLPAGQTAALLVGTLIPALALLVLLGRRLAIRRAAGSTARMHVRLVFFFSLVAAVPTLMVAGFSSYLFQSGVEFWFSNNSRGLIADANELARNYYDENQREVGDETLAMASDLRFYLQRDSITSASFPEVYWYQTVARKLDESAILQLGADGKFRVAAIIDPEEKNTRERITAEALSEIDRGKDVAITASRDKIEAVTPIDRNAGIFLYNARSSTGQSLALRQWNRAQSVLRDYDQLTGNARSRQLTFNLALFFASLALVGLAVWFALRFADRQVQPLTDLVGAAREVGQGNYSLRVAGRTGADEIGLLNRAFNRMTSQIERQTKQLLGANEQLDERRAFIEAVLESITAGIISVDGEGRVLLMNSSAQELLLGRAGPAPVGLSLDEVAPQIAQMQRAGLTNGIVQYARGSELLTLAVKFSPDAEGHVITFEDITRQLLDQRQAAWSDVARRIAHEIKNPLTPIQLATERLKRRYRKQIASDAELFDELTSTIIRQVGDLRKMVDEFSSFARLPKPVFRQEDAVDLVRQALFLQEVARTDIRFDLEVAPDVPRIACDRHQFGQAMTNVLKNATEAVEARARNAEPDYRPRVSVAVTADDDSLTVAIADNGIGLPQDSENIVEPYVTTREKGTGLGLAIVNKIVEEHGGEMTFAPSDSGGTRVTMRFAREPVGADERIEAAE